MASNTMAAAPAADSAGPVGSDARRNAAKPARAEGFTWSQIATMYGMSKQAAQQRFRDGAVESDAGTHQKRGAVGRSST